MAGAAATTVAMATSTATKAPFANCIRRAPTSRAFSSRPEVGDPASEDAEVVAYRAAFEARVAQQQLRLPPRCHENFEEAEKVTELYSSEKVSEKVAEL